MKGISICYITNRRQPLLQWFIDSLGHELKRQPVPVEVIVVDYWKNLRTPAITNNSPDFELRVVEPLPSYCQGRHRLTGKDYFSATISRNTGFVYARYGYVVFIDDLSVIMPGWLSCVVEAARGGYCVLGSYRKDKNMVVTQGRLVSSQPCSYDSRLPYTDRDVKRATGQWLYGCSFGLPLKTALEVNGFDELCSIISSEDTQFGIRVQRTGMPVFFDRRMLTVESEEHHFAEGNFFERFNPVTDKSTYMAALARFGVHQQPAHKYEAAWAVLDLLEHLPAHTQSFGTRYSLQHLRSLVEQGSDITPVDMCFPDRFWFLDVPLSEL